MRVRILHRPRGLRVAWFLVKWVWSGGDAGRQSSDGESCDTEAHTWNLEWEWKHGRMETWANGDQTLAVVHVYFH